MNFLFYYLILVATIVCCTDIEDTRNGESRIVGGFLAAMNSTKHQVSIRLLSVDLLNFGKGHFCGGSLINNVTVLTTAHCLYSSNHELYRANEFRIVGGNSRRDLEDSSTFISTVSKTVPHNDYDRFSLVNDIGLIILSEAAPANHCSLAPIPMIKNKIPDNTTCQISGWGATSLPGNASLVLLAANVSIINTATCNGEISYGGQIQKGMMCAGRMEAVAAGGVDACDGDSGGPLVCNGKLTGITSYGVYCAEPFYPGVYTDIMMFQDWIKANDSNRLVSEKIFICTCLVIIIRSMYMYRI